MITTIVGVLGAAVFFGLFALLRPNDRSGCTGSCPGCKHDHACMKEPQR